MARIMMMARRERWRPEIVKELGSHLAGGSFDFGIFLLLGELAP